MFLEDFVEFDIMVTGFVRFDPRRPTGVSGRG